MAKAKRPVTVDGIPFDALLDETRVYEAESPDYPVENGFTVNDTIILKPLSLSMTLFVTDTPVTWLKQGHGGRGWADSVIQRLEKLYFSKNPVTVVTSDKTYKSMAIQSITIAKSAEVGYARQIPITFKEIRVTQSRQASIPASYGKSGASGANAGAASTNTSSTPPASNTGGGTAGGSTSSAAGGSKGSIAYNLAKSAGLL